MKGHKFELLYSSTFILAVQILSVRNTVVIYPNILLS